MAKAYVELGEDFATEDSERSKETKRAPSRDRGELMLGRERAENSAVARYLEDNEWEAAELRAGRAARPPQFPFFAARDKVAT